MLDKFNLIPYFVEILQSQRLNVDNLYKSNYCQILNLFTDILFFVRILVESFEKHFVKKLYIYYYLIRC